MNTFIETFRSLGPARLALMAGVAAAILAFFVYFTDRLSQAEMELLFNQLDPADSGEIVTQLEAKGIPYELNHDGSRILVPADQVARLRLAMAEQGLPSGGSLGYEIFDRSEGLGSSSFVQNINHVRALEGELARTISSLGNVRQARVHLVLPQRELFSRERNLPSASIVLTLAGAQRLAKQQVRAVQQLVASAVPRLEPERVAIIDDKGNLLARTSNGDEADELASTADEMRIALENRLTRTVEALLERSVGPGNVRAEVAAELDFDRITENSETYDPDGQVVRSTQVVEESAQDTESDNEAVTVANNLPDADLQDLGGAGNSSVSNRTEETVNYEISRVVKTHVRESGVVRRLSVAVLVNGAYLTDEDGESSYQARSAEELEQLAALAKSAVGFDAQRGDTFEIANLRFADMSEGLERSASPQGLLGIDERELLRVAELLVLGIVAVLVLLLVVKPLVTRLVERQAAGAGDPASLLPPELREQQALEGPEWATGDGSPGSAGLNTAVAERTGIAGLPEGAIGADGEDPINVDQVEGRVRASALRKVNEIIERHPEEAVAIVRSWLYQES